MTTFTLTITFDGDAPNATYSRLGTLANDLQNEFENARVSLEAEATAWHGLHNEPNPFSPYPLVDEN